MAKDTEHKFYRYTPGSTEVIDYFASAPITTDPMPLPEDFKRSKMWEAQLWKGEPF